MDAGINERRRVSDQRSGGLSRLRDPASTNSEPNEFVARLTEEVRTNLQAMLGFTQLMQRDQKEPLPERQRERARQILEAGDRLLHMLDEAAVLSRTHWEQFDMKTQAVDVLRVFQRVRAELEPLAVSRKLELVLGSSLPPPPLVAADPWGVTEILLKLAANAIAYNKPRGSVRLQVSPIPPARVRISVIDTGIGVPFEEQHKLFQPFPHVAGQSRCMGGAGLGLATCRRLATLMGGSVGCRSVPDQGSEFWLELPAHPQSAAASLQECD